MNCPFCNSPNEADATFCVACGRSIPAPQFAAPPALTSGAAYGQAVSAAPAVIPTFSVEAPEIQKMRSRYRNAYQVARTIVGVGGSFKVIGVILSGLIVILSFMAITQTRSGMGLAMGILGLVIGLIVGALIYLIGVIVAAQGQILKANLDTAVNTSPFLTNDIRAEIMSLK